MLSGTAQPPALVNGAFPSVGGSFSGFADGTAAAPGAYFAAEPSLGFYRVSAGVLGFASGGSGSLKFSASGTISGAGVFQPTISFLSSGELNLAAGSGSNQSVTVTPSGSGGFIVNSGFVRVPDGSAAAPVYSFTNDTDTGIYRPGANQFGISTGGAVRVIIANAQIQIQSGVALRLGNNYVAVAPGAATGTVTIQDGTGTTYRIPVLV